MDIQITDFPRLLVLFAGFQLLLAGISTVFAVFHAAFSRDHNRWRGELVVVIALVAVACLVGAFGLMLPRMRIILGE